MAKIVEEVQSLTVAEIVRAGLLTLEGPTRTKIGGFTVAWPRKGDQLEVRFVDAQGQRKTQAVEFTRRQLTFGERLYFVCPMSGKAALKLYLANDQLGSREAHGLSHQSRLKPKQYRSTRHADPHRPGVRIETSTKAELKAGRASSAWVEQHVLVSLVNAKNPYQFLPVTGVIETWGWACVRPRLEILALQRAGLLQPRRPRAVLLTWPGATGAVDFVMAAIVWASAFRPIVISAVINKGKVVAQQAIGVERAGERWLFICPETGARTRTLYLREQRFASRTAQGLMLGNRLPDRPYTRKLSHDGAHELAGLYDVAEILAATAEDLLDAAA